MCDDDDEEEEACDNCCSFASISAVDNAGIRGDVFVVGGVGGYECTADPSFSFC